MLFSKLVSRGIAMGMVFLFSPAALACAMFTFSQDGRVYMGNNEDFIKPGVVWFVPAKKNRYGRVNFGFDDRFCQGSMNDQGLSFDAAVVGEVPYEPDSKKRTPKNLIEKIMDECATVDEAIEYFNRYNCPHLSRTQFMFADKTGDSAVVAWLPGKGLSVVRKEGAYQLITNTRLEASSFRCERYVLAERKLQVATVGEASDLHGVLAEIHQRGAQAYTSYSTIFDLTRGEVIVYNLADYSESKTINLADELAKGAHDFDLMEWFEHKDGLDAITKSAPRIYETEVPLDVELLKKYAGKYKVGDPAVEITLAVSGNELIMSSAGNTPAHLFPESETSFRIREGGQITMRMGDDGSVDGFFLHRFGDYFAARVQ